MTQGAVAPSTVEADLRLAPRLAESLSRVAAYTEGFMAPSDAARIIVPAACGTKWSGQTGEAAHKAPQRAALRTRQQRE